MSGRARDARDRSEARGTPPVTPTTTYKHIWDKVLDGSVWEIHPDDHRTKPRRFYLEARQYLTKQGITAMVVKRDHLVYVQNLDIHADSRTLDVRALNGRRPTLVRWLLPSEQTEEQPAEPGEENDAPALESPFRRPQPNPQLRLAGRGESNVNIPAKKLEPFVLTVMNRYFEHALTVAEVQRAVIVLVRDSHETREVHDQQVRICLNGLVQDPDTSLFTRPATIEETHAMGGGRIPHLYSATDPVPGWSQKIHDEIVAATPEFRTRKTKSPDEPRLRAPRVFKRAPIEREPEIAPPEMVHVPPEPERVVVEQPTYKVTTRDPERPINGVDLRARAAQLSADLAELLVEIDSLPSIEDRRLTAEALSQANAEVRRLQTENARLDRERTEAVDQLRAVAQAQRTLAQLLAGGK